MVSDHYERAWLRVLGGLYRDAGTRTPSREAVPCAPQEWTSVTRGALEKGQIFQKVRRQRVIAFSNFSVRFDSVFF